MRFARSLVVSFVCATSVASVSRAHAKPLEISVTAPSALFSQVAGGGAPGGRWASTDAALGSFEDRHRVPSGGSSHAPPAYPADLTYLGGPVLQQAVQHAVYVLLPEQTVASVPVPDTWGDPETFLRDLGRSDFIHVIDQYTGSTAPDRYTLGSSVIVHFDPGPGRDPTQLLDSDAAQIAHAVAAYLGTGGDGQLFHLFLPPGTDICYNPPFVGCYSPDNPARFTVCAYHYSAAFADIPRVVYSVQPYQAVDGCMLPAPTPNGPLVDSTDNALSHEVFESLTEPIGSDTAWANWWQYFMVDGENELADECEFVSIDLSAGAVQLQVPTFPIGDHFYAVQSEYSNAAHACVIRP